MYRSPTWHTEARATVVHIAAGRNPVGHGPLKLVRHDGNSHPRMESHIGSNSLPQSERMWWVADVRLESVDCSSFDRLACTLSA